MDKMQTIEASDDHQFNAYGVQASERALANLVVIQEIFGVNKHIRSVADGFAADGFNVLAPAIFDRIQRNVELPYDDEGLGIGRELKAAMELDPVLLDIKACIDNFNNELPTSVIGYCFGGKLAFASSRLTGLHRCIGYYGGAIPELLPQERNCPVQLHFGEMDHSIPTAEIETIRQQCPDVDIHVYANAGHGFNCDQRSQYHADSATLARQRSLSFLRDDFSTG